MEPKKMKILVVGLVGVAAITLVAGFLFQYYAMDRNDTASIYFLKTKGQILTTPGQEQTVQVFCFGDRQNPLLQEGSTMIPVQTDNKNIDVLESEILAGSTYKGMTLFTIIFDVDAGQPGNQKITQIILTDLNGNQKAFDIGEIDIDVQAPNRGNAIDLREEPGVTGRSGAYGFRFKNQATKACVMTGIDFGPLASSFEDVKITVNEKEVDAQRDVIIQPGDLVFVWANLKAETPEDVFLISSIIRYHMQGETEAYSYPLTYGLIGLPDTKDSFQALYEKVRLR